MRNEWSSKPLNLLSPEVIAEVGNALETGLLCGVHAFYCSGRGVEPCAFADLQPYLRAVETSRPGDWFTLWSLPALIERDFVLIQKEGTPVTAEELRRVRDWLNESPLNEFPAVGIPTNGIPPETSWGDYDSFDELRELAEKCALKGKFTAVPLSKLVEENEHQWIPKLHLVDAKCPNDRGEVPLGGSY